MTYQQFAHYCADEHGNSRRIQLMVCVENLDKGLVVAPFNVFG